MIDENYAQIKENITKYLGATQAGLFRYNRNLIIDELMSYIPDAALEFNESVGELSDFANFIAKRCILRYIDEYRRLHRHVRIGSAKRLKIRKIKREIIQSDKDATEDYINKILAESGLNSEDQDKRVREQLGYHTVVTNSFVDQNLQNIDTMDQIEGIAKRAEEYFVESDAEAELVNRSARVRKKLINEFLIPLALGQPKKKLSQIALEVQLSVGRLSQMMRDASMQKFVKTIYPEIDSNKRPVMPR